MSRFASVHRRPVVNQKMTTPAWAPCDLLSTPNAIQFSCRMMFSFCLKVVAISTKGSKRLLAFGFEREEVFHADIHDSKSSPAPIMETQWKMTSLVSQIATYSSIFYDLMGCVRERKLFLATKATPTELISLLTNLTQEHAQAKGLHSQVASADQTFNYHRKLFFFLLADVWNGYGYMF